MFGLILASACKTKGGQFQGASPVTPGISRTAEGGFVGTPNKQGDLSDWTAPKIDIFRVPIAGSDLYAIGLRWNLIKDSIVNEVSLCNGPKCWTIKTTKNMSIYYAIPKDWKGANLTAFLRHCPDVIDYKKNQCSPAGKALVKAEYFPGLSGNDKVLQAMDLEQEAIEQGIAVHAVITEQALSLTGEINVPHQSLVKNIANQGPYAFSESILNWEEEAAFLTLTAKKSGAQLALVDEKYNDQSPFTKQNLRSMSSDEQKTFAVIYHNPGYCGHMRFVQNSEELLNALGDPVSKSDVRTCMANVESGEGGQKKVHKGLYIGGVISLALGSGMMLLALISHYPRTRAILFPLLVVLNLTAAIFTLADGEWNFRDFWAISNISDALILGSDAGVAARDLRIKSEELGKIAQEKFRDLNVNGLDANEAKIVLNNPNSSRAKKLLTSKNIEISSFDLENASTTYKAKELELEERLRVFKSKKTNLRIGGIGVIAAAIGATLIYKSNESYKLAEKQLSRSDKNFDQKLATSLEGMLPLLKKRMTLLVPNYQ